MKNIRDAWNKDDTSARLEALQWRDRDRDKIARCIEAIQSGKIDKLEKTL